MDSPHSVTTLTITVDSRVLTATFDPALNVEERQQIERAAATEHHISTVVRVLLLHAATRLLRVEVEEEPFSASNSSSRR